jgi:hypothetical protein
MSFLFGAQANESGLSAASPDAGALGSELAHLIAVDRCRRVQSPIFGQLCFAQAPDSTHKNHIYADLRQPAYAQD